MKLKLSLQTKEKIENIGAGVAFFGGISFSVAGIVDAFYEKSVSAAKAVTFLAGQIQSGNGEFTMLVKDLLRVTDGTDVIYSLKDHAKEAADIVINKIIPGTGGQMGFPPTWSETAMEYMLKINNIDVTNAVGNEHLMYLLSGAVICGTTGALIYKIAKRM